MKKNRELQPEDFPGYDQDKIRVWLKERKKLYIYFFVLIIVFFILSIILSKGTDRFVRISALDILIAGFIAYLLNYKARNLEKELGLNSSIIKRAMRGELINLQTANSGNASKNYCHKCNKIYDNVSRCPIHDIELTSLI